MSMQSITFSPAEKHIFSLVSHIKTAEGLSLLMEQLALFYAKQVDEGMDKLWDSGEWNDEKLVRLGRSHLRTTYK